MEWDDYFLNICDAVALKSKDESTKLGAVVVGPDKEIRATGYNSFPRGIRDGVASRQRRPEKYKWFEHAERNAVYCASRHGASLKQCTLYCQWLPCPDCARGIINSGITEICVRSFEVPERWRGDMTIAVTMLQEAGVMVRLPNGTARPYDEILEIVNGRRHT